MRVTTSSLYATGLANMQTQQAALNRSQDQIGTGRKFSAAGEDPVGMARVLSLHEAKTLQQRYSQNVGTLQQRLGGADNALASVSDVLTRVKELTVQANSAALSSDNRQAIATELTQLKAQLVDLANSNDGAGHYSFAGTAESTRPFADSGSAGVQYTGSEDVRQLAVGDGHLVAESESGDAVFLRVPGSGGSLFARLDAVIATVNAPSTTDAERLANAAAFTSGLQSIDDGLTHIGNLRASLGARMATLDSVQGHLDGVAETLDQTLSSVQDIDYAEAVSRLQLQSTSLQAAQAAFAKVQGLSLFNYLR